MGLGKLCGTRSDLWVVFLYFMGHRAQHTGAPLLARLIYEYYCVPIKADGAAVCSPDRLFGADDYCPGDGAFLDPSLLGGSGLDGDHYQVSHACRGFAAKDTDDQGGLGAAIVNNCYYAFLLYHDARLLRGRRFEDFYQAPPFGFAQRPGFGNAYEVSCHAAIFLVVHDEAASLPDEFLIEGVSYPALYLYTHGLLGLVADDSAYPLFSTIPF